MTLGINENESKSGKYTDLYLDLNVVARCARLQPIEGILMSIIQPLHTLELL